MGNNRRKAVKDRPRHREKVKKWQAKKVARRVADRLLGIKKEPESKEEFWTYSYHNSKTGATTTPTKI